MTKAQEQRMNDIFGNYINERNFYEESISDAFRYGYQAAMKEAVELIKSMKNCDCYIGCNEEIDDFLKKIGAEYMTRKVMLNLLQRMVLNRDHKKALERKIDHLTNRIKIHKGNPSFDKAELSSLLQCKSNSELAENIIKEMENNDTTK